MVLWSMRDDMERLYGDVLGEEAPQALAAEIFARPLNVTEIVPEEFNRRAGLAIAAGTSMPSGRFTEHPHYEGQKPMKDSGNRQKISR